MTEPAHYSHGPSGASRWLICTDSPFAQAGYPDETTDAADEGTAAHWLLEQCLNAGQNADTYVDCSDIKSVPAGEETGCVKYWPITGEMIEAVQLHIDTVLPDAKKKGTRMFVEERVRLDHAMGLPHPVGGTADTILYMPRSKVLKIVDFKYGRGHVVEVKNPDGTVNPQLGIYALAALAELERLLGEKREVKWVELTIVQPRAPHKKGPVRTLKLSPFQLMDLEADVYRALTEPPIRIAGDHCHFCRAKPDCEVFHADRHTKATADFAAEEEPDGTLPVETQQAEVPSLQAVGDLLARPVKSLTREELGQARRLASHVRAWLKEVDEEVKTRLLHDIPIPGARLAPGRGSRSFGGTPAELEAAATRTAYDLGLPDSDLYVPAKLKSAAALEKELGKGKFKDTPLAKLVTYTAGGPVVVDEDSDAPDWTPADVFEAEEEEVTSSLL